MCKSLYSVYWAAIQPQFLSIAHRLSSHMVHHWTALVYFKCEFVHYCCWVTPAAKQSPHNAGDRLLYNSYAGVSLTLKQHTIYCMHTGNALSAVAYLLLCCQYKQQAATARSEIVPCVVNWQQLQRTVMMCTVKLSYKATTEQSACCGHYGSCCLRECMYSITMAYHVSGKRHKTACRCPDKLALQQVLMHTQSVSTVELLCKGISGQSACRLIWHMLAAAIVEVLVWTLVLYMNTANALQCAALWSFTMYSQRQQRYRTCIKHCVLQLRELSKLPENVQSVYTLSS